MSATRTQPGSQVDRHYRKLSDRSVSAGTEFRPEDVWPAPGMILTRLVPPDTMTAGGLYLPENRTNKEKGTAVVITVNEQDEKTCYYQKGDVIIYARYAGQPVDFAQTSSDEGEYVLFQWEDAAEVFGKITGAGRERILKALDVKKKSP